jgi:hypothetical protein
MDCPNTRCSIYLICQNKDKPCPGNAVEKATYGNRSVPLMYSGYAAMARQEQAMRNSAIDFAGDWCVP